MPPSPSYYEHAREDVVALLPLPLGRVLDVGCGAGGAGGPLRARGATWLTGIELVPEVAERARAHYDEVLVGPAQERVGDVGSGPFDTILCYDVLEHLPEPEGVLTALRALAAPGARLHVSLPNARHFSLARDVVLRGTFNYADEGHRDRTHLRWFTARDIEAAVARAGWIVQPRPHPALQRPLHRLTRGRLAEFTFAQWLVLAVAPG